MNMSAHVDPHKSGHEVWEEFSQSFTPAVREVVEFAKKIPGFRDLSQPDQVSLLKAGTFEVHYIFLNNAMNLCHFSYEDVVVIMADVRLTEWCLCPAGVGGSLRLSV